MLEQTNDLGSEEELAEPMTRIDPTLGEQRFDRASPAPSSLAPARPEPGSARPLPAVEPFTLTKAELAEMLFEKVGLNKREAKDMVETFFDEIRAALERGESVKLSGFGNFQLRDKPQRPGRNPKTGEEIPITARRVVTFHASQKLKSMVEEANPANPDGPDNHSLARAA